MPAVPDSNPKRFVQGSPVLHVEDVIATAEYYQDSLGFCWDFGDENYAVVWRDNAAVHFTRGEGAPSGVHIFFWIRDVDAYYDEIRALDTATETVPTTQPYGIREFSISDLNGVTVVFGQDDQSIGSDIC